jgi:hypothetical protein
MRPVIRQQGLNPFAHGPHRTRSNRMLCMALLAEVGRVERLRRLWGRRSLQGFVHPIEPPQTAGGHVAADRLAEPGAG